MANEIEVGDNDSLDFEFDGWNKKYIITMPDGNRYSLTAERAEYLAFQILEQLKIYDG